MVTADYDRCGQGSVGHQGAHHRHPGRCARHLGVGWHADAAANGQRAVVTCMARALAAIDKQPGDDHCHQDRQQVELEQNGQHHGCCGNGGDQGQVGGLRQHDQLLGFAAGDVHAQRFWPAVAGEAQITLTTRQRECGVARGCAFGGGVEVGD